MKTIYAVCGFAFVIAVACAVAGLTGKIAEYECKDLAPGSEWRFQPRDPFAEPILYRVVATKEGHVQYYILDNVTGRTIGTPSSRTCGSFKRDTVVVKGEAK